MDAHFSKSKQYEIAYVLDEQALRRLSEILTQSVNTLTFSIECSDKTLIKFNNVDDLLKFPNSKDRAITQLSIANSYGQSLHLELRFDSNRFVYSVSYKVSGKEDEVIVTETKLNNLIENLKANYTRLARFITEIWLVAAGMLFLGLSPSSNSSSFLLELFRSMSGLCFFLLILFYPLQKRTYPVSTFLIGDGVKRYENVKIWRERAVGFVLGIFAGIVATFLWDQFT